MGNGIAGRRRSSAERQRHPSAPRRPVSPPDPNAPRRWRERTWFAFIVRAVVLVVPLLISFLVAFWLSHALAMPGPFWVRVLRWLGIAAVSTIVLVVLQQAMRRLLPLSAMLSLTLVFPDEAPSRFRIALRSFSARDLDRALHDVGTGHPDGDAQQAAESLLVLVGGLSRHDRLTRGHSERVRAYSLMIGEEMGLAPDELDRLRWAALLHDVGKMYVPATILNKPGRLTDDEFALVREHTTHGAALTAGLGGWLGDEVRAVDQHHERWEGGGYPYGLRGEQIVPAARIVSVADAFDVMTSARSYKQPMPATAARAELERCAGSQFDPSVVRAMLSISLGKLWRAMGPLSLFAQLRLFPRQATSGGATAATTIAAGVAMAITAIAGMVTGDRGTVADVAKPLAAAVALPARVEGPGAAPPSGAAVPHSVAATTITSTSTTSTTSTSSTTTSSSSTTSTSTTVPSLAVAAPATPTTLPIATATVPAATTSTTTTVPAATTTTTTTTSSPTTTTTSSTTSTTTVPPPAAVVLTLASSGVGDAASQPILQLAGERPPANGATLPNYDTDRNADPGLTIARSLRVLETSDPAGGQVWQFPADVVEVPAVGSLTLWIAPAAPVAPVDVLLVRAGLFDCDATRTSCLRLVRDTVSVAPVTGVFAPVGFDLSVGSATPLRAGHRFELRFAVLSASDLDVWLGYDSAVHPSVLVLGP